MTIKKNHERKINKKGGRAEVIDVNYFEQGSVELGFREEER